MPENCAFLDCPHSRRYEGMSLFKIPTRKASDSEHTSQIKLEARSAWKTAILRTRQETSELRERFTKNNIFICEHHFEQDCIESFPYTDKHGNEKVRKKLETGAIPTLNLPVKTLDILPGTSTPQERRVLIRHEQQSSSSASSAPPSFNDLKKYFERQYPYLRDWTVTMSDNNITVEMREPGFLIPKYFIQIEESLEITVAVYGATVPNSCSVLFPENHSRLCSKFKDLHSLLCSLGICCGISSEKEPSSETIMHVIPLVAPKNQSSPINYSQLRRSRKCEILIRAETDKCKTCTKFDEKKNQAKPVLPAKAKAPLTACSPAKLQETVREDRIKLKESEFRCMQLEDRVKRMEEEIGSHGVRIEDDLSNSFLAILDQNQTNLQATPHMRLVFEQQQKAMMSNKHARRWHPHFVEFCLSIHAKSSSVYNELRKSEKNPDGILYLPHERTLRDYRNHFKPAAGFVLENIEVLKSIVKSYEGAARYVVLVFDEMKIKGRLVFDKHSGKLIGFTSLGDPDLDFSTFEELEVASHVLAFMVRGVQTTLKFMLVYFLTQTVVSYQLVPIYWRAVGILELNCGLHVVGTVSDGMSANRKFFRVHKHISGEQEKEGTQGMECVNKTMNLYAPQRNIWFFADAPHLMKTTRGKKMFVVKI